MTKRGNIFSMVETNRPSSNEFNLTHDRKFSTKFGQLTPIMVMDCVPGDSVKLSGNAMVRLAPLIAPIMHRIDVTIHYFFVPHRIVMQDWEKFITGGEDGEDNTIWSYGEYDPAEYDAGDLPDYMGLPVETDFVGSSGNTFNVSALPFLSYQKIWNEYYRDQNLQTAVLDETTSGEIDGTDWEEITTMRNRAWRHDYFTSALPFTQKGPEAMLPLGTTAPVVAKNDALGPPDMLQYLRLVSNENIDPNADLTSDANGWLTGNSTSYLDLGDSHYADLSSAASASINDLRRAIHLQVWLERNARGGSRYTESIAVHFGVQSSDKRLNRPEFIGGMRSPVKVSEVLQTSNNDTQETPQGNMAGHAISVGGGKKYKYFCEEHGYIIGLMSVMPEPAYQQGIPRHFSRDDKFDYYWPEFAHIGEQPIYGREVAITNSSSYNNGVFGYTPRYAEYKYMMNTVHGDFKTTMDFWHLGRKFSSLPNLNSAFIEMRNQETDRVFAVQDGTDTLWCQVLNEVYARRLMPVFGTPRIN
jgi:hypothetical protein